MEFITPPYDEGDDVYDLNNVYDVGINFTLMSNNMTNDSLTPYNITDHGNQRNIFWIRFFPYTALSCCCVIFNALSLAAMTNIRGHRTVHHTLLLNLASGDMVGSILLWMYYNSPVIFPRFAITRLEHCLFLHMVLVAPFIMSLCTSALALMMLALNQYIAICSPLFSTTSVTRGKACLCIVIAWIVSYLIAMLPASFILFLARFEDCSQYAQAIGQKSLEVCTYALAVLIMFIVGLYAKIYHEVLRFRHRSNQLNRRPGRTPDKANGRTPDTERNYKAFITTLLLSGTLVIFWLPYMIFNFISAHIDLENAPDILWQVKFYVMDFLPVLNFLTDPIIYGIRMREIRDGYKRLFYRMCPRFVKEPRRNTRSSVRFTTLTTNI